MQLLRFSDSSCALAGLGPFKPFTISVPLTCRHSERFRFFRVLTDSSEARPAGDVKHVKSKQEAKEE